MSENTHPNIPSHNMAHEGGKAIGLSLLTMVTKSTAVPSVVMVATIIPTTGNSLDRANKRKTPTLSGHTTRGTIIGVPGPTIKDNTGSSPGTLDLHKATIVIVAIATATDRATIPPGLISNDLVPNVRTMDTIILKNRVIVESASVTPLAAVTAAATVPGGTTDVTGGHFAPPPVTGGPATARGTSGSPMSKDL